MPSMPERIRAAVPLLLDVSVPQPAVRVERGLTNENWLVTCADRTQLLVKVAPAEVDPGKAAAASHAWARAVAHGARVSREILFDPACALLDDRPVRIVEYVDGVHPEAVLTSPSGIQRFFADRVSGVVGARLTHRDLHLDNVVAGRRGDVAAIGQVLAEPL